MARTSELAVAARLVLRHRFQRRLDRLRLSLLPPRLVSPAVLDRRSISCSCGTFVHLKSGGRTQGSQASSFHSMFRARFATQLVLLNEFGFTDEAANLSALESSDGNVEVALDLLIAMREEGI